MTVCPSCDQSWSNAMLIHLWFSIPRCQQLCTSCQLGCMHSVTHSTEILHDCSTSHKCNGYCEYAECRGLMESAAPPCSRSAGHQGKCECKKGEHTCGQRCVLSRASNCDKTCSQVAEHAGDHRCSVQVYICGSTCSGNTCNAACVFDIQRDHSVHKCVEMQCLHQCFMNGCKNTCGEKDHFHGQLTESRLFADESGIMLSEDAMDNEVITHMCLGSHACLNLCEVDGICEQKVHLKKSSRTYAGVRSSFEYIYQEMNACKKQCTRVLPGGMENHEGVIHSCIAQKSSNEQSSEVIHYCDVRCPCCDYYCNKHFGHMGLHTTSHGNRRQAYFIAKGNDIDIEDRKYVVGEEGIAEMCNLFCAKMGRGHLHYLPCEGNDRENCVYTADASKDHRRHCDEQLYPPPNKPMDELLHLQFWTTIGWEDPCTEEERVLFSKYPFQCDALEHDEADKPPSFCLLDAWHKSEMKPNVDDGFSCVDGHKFECVHAVDSGKFHSIFVLDSSGSMNGQPWRDLLYACNEYVSNRLKDGGDDDLISFITFDSHSRIHCEAKPLKEAWGMKIPFSGGGTHFEEGLNAANEILSRNNFEQFRTVLIFFSDGQPWKPDLGYKYARHIRSTYAKFDLRVFTVGFGSVNLEVIKSMDNELGDRYRQVLDATALKTEFQRIAAVLRKNEASLALLKI